MCINYLVLTGGVSHFTHFDFGSWLEIFSCPFSAK
jgi:hypothetical protein